MICISLTKIQTESEMVEKDTPFKHIAKWTGVAILMSDKIDYHTTAIIRHKEGNYILIHGSVLQEDVTTVNIYANNAKKHSYLK